MYEDLLERNKLQISELNTLTEEQDRHIVKLEKENAELEEQIEKMKCCENTRVGSTFEKVLENLKLLVDSFGSDNIQFQYVIKLPNQTDNHSQIKNFFFQNFKICGQITYDTLELDESSKKTFHNFEK